MTAFRNVLLTGGSQQVDLAAIFSGARIYCCRLDGYRVTRGE